MDFLHLTESARKLKDVASALKYGMAKGLRDNPPVLLDIGSRGGLATKWHLINRCGFLTPLLVEPDPDEAENLRFRLPRAKVLPFALWNVDGPVELNLTRLPACSSVLVPDLDTMRLLGRADEFEIVRRVSVPARRFDTLALEMGLPQPDFLKVDVQGGELYVFDGLGTLIDAVTAIECECHFVQHYVGESLFHELYQRLWPAFGLVALRPFGMTDGRIIEANAFFVRRDSHSERVRILTEFWTRLMNIPSGREYSIRSG